MTCCNDGLTGDHLAFSGGILQAPLNPLKTDVSRGPPGLSGGPGPLRPHRNSTTGGDPELVTLRWGQSVLRLSRNTTEPRSASFFFERRNAAAGFS